MDVCWRRRGSARRNWRLASSRDWKKDLVTVVGMQVHLHQYAYSTGHSIYHRNKNHDILKGVPVQAVINSLSLVCVGSNIQMETPRMFVVRDRIVTSTHAISKDPSAIINIVSTSVAIQNRQRYSKQFCDPISWYVRIIRLLGICQLRCVDLLGHSSIIHPIFFWTLSLLPHSFPSNHIAERVKTEFWR